MEDLAWVGACECLLAGGVRGGGVRRLLIVSKVKVQCSSGVLLNDKEVKLPMLKKSLSPARIFLEINHMRKYRVVVHTVQLDFKRLRKTFYKQRIQIYI